MKDFDTSSDEGFNDQFAAVTVFRLVLTAHQHHSLPLAAGCGEAFKPLQEERLLGYLLIFHFSLGIAGITLRLTAQSIPHEQVAVAPGFQEIL
jgi:hypothetical protein